MSQVLRQRPMTVVVAMVIAAVMLGGFLAWGSSRAETKSTVGYANWDLIWELYAGERVQAIMDERDRLQALFDAESAGLSDDEKLSLFHDYESRLQTFEEQQNLGELYGHVSEAMRLAAEASGVSVIVDHYVVLHGGVDLTADVLRLLGIS